MMSARVDRPFGGAEAMIDALDRLATMNFVTVARVAGPLSRELLEDALLRLQRRHPLLACRIVRRGDAWPAYEHDPSLRFSLRIVQAAEDDWVHESQRELDRSDWPAAESPGRLVVLEHGGERRTLLLSCNHRVTDGTGGVLAMRDLLRLAWEPGHAPPALPSGPMEGYLPAELRGPSVTAKSVAYWARRFAAELTAGKPHTLEAVVDVPPRQRRTRVVPRALDVAATCALAARARTEATTVHGALAAAHLVALRAELPPGEPVVLQCNHAVNVRNVLRDLGVSAPELDERLGYLVSFMETVHAVRGDESPAARWELARAITRRLREGRARREPVIKLPLVTAVMRRLAASGSDRLLRALSDLLVHDAVVVTNLGRLPIEETFAGGAVETMHFVAASSIVAPCITAVTTYRGELRMNLCYQEPALSAAFAHAVAARTEGSLVEMTRVKL